MMPPVNNYRCLAILRDDLSGWVEVKPLATKEAKGVARFIWEVICRFGIFGILVVDGGKEFVQAVSALLEKYKVKHVRVSAYHPEANRIIERGHKPIVDALAKMSSEGKGNWLENLQSVLLADRVTVKTTTAVSSIRMNYGYKPLLPIKAEVSIRSYMEWSKARITSELLRLRALQFQRRDEDLLEA
jgi:hypothetical protein